MRPLLLSSLALLLAACSGTAGEPVEGFVEPPPGRQATPSGANPSEDAGGAAAEASTSDPEAASSPEAAAPEAAPSPEAASPDAAPDGGVDTGIVAACGPTTCPDGCCNSAGLCVSGLLAPECGSGGQACSVCPDAGGLRCAPIYGVGNVIVGGWCCNGPHGAVCQ